MATLLGLGLVPLLLLAHEGGRYGAERLLGLAPRLVRAQPAPGPRWKRVATSLAAPIAAHLFIAALALVRFAGFGVETGTAYYVVGLTQPGHAAHGKLLPGDEIREIAGEPVFFERDGRAQPHLMDRIQRHMERQGPPLALTILRDGQPMTVELTPKLDPLMEPPVYRLGVMLEGRREVRPMGMAAVGPALVYPTRQAILLLRRMSWLLFDATEGELSGPVGVVHAMHAAGEDGIAAALQATMSLLVQISLMLLLPLTALRLALSLAGGAGREADASTPGESP